MGNKSSRNAQKNAERLKQEYQDRKIRESIVKKLHADDLGSNFTPQKILVDQSSQTYESFAISRPASSYFHKLNRRGLLIAIGCYFIGCFLFAVSERLQSYLVYLHILRWPLGDLKDLHYVSIPNARNIQFKTEDGLIIHGYHVFPTRMPHNESEHEVSLATAERIFLYLHGNGATRAYRFRRDVVKDLAILGSAHVLSIDYRGFGDSQGWPSEKGTLLDTRAVMHYIDKIVDINNKDRKRPAVFVYGQSLGTAIGTALVRDMQENHNAYKTIIAGLILDSPFSTLKDAAITHPVGIVFRLFPAVRNFMLKRMKIHYATSDIIHETQVPVLLLHGGKDWKVPLQNSIRLKDKLLSSHYKETDYSECLSSEKSLAVQLKVFPEAGHDDVCRGKGWREIVQDFVDCLAQ